MKKFLLITLFISMFILPNGSYAQSLSDEVVGEYQIRNLSVNKKKIDKYMPTKFIVKKSGESVNEVEFILIYYTSKNDSLPEFAYGIDSLARKGKRIYSYFKDEHVAVFKDGRIIYKQNPLFKFKGRKKTIFTTLI